jgi:hypothetical protein
MAKNKSTSKAAKIGTALKTEDLRSLAAELQQIRQHKPLVKRSDGQYQGDILGFVKGLRLSARVIYYIREQLSDSMCDVNWGHLLDSEERSCSPECDVIIHKKGHIRKWNGHTHSIMDFTFIRVSDAHAVVSCKSILYSIDKKYPKELKKFGIKNILLFAECCEKSKFKSLEARAKKAGYKGLWCLYMTDKDGAFVNMDENSYLKFIKVLRKAANIK